MLWKISGDKIRRKIFYIVIFLSQCVLCRGQGIVNNYLFGYYGFERGILDFPNKIATVNPDSNITIKISYTHTNISDTSGNLLFYTNGVSVIDANHDTMLNGTGLNPCSYTTQVAYDGLSIPQADLILPFPGSPSKYYLVHQSWDNLGLQYNSTLYYSIIDMALNNGFGSVIQKNIVLYQDTLWGASTTACKHANGRDWWIVVLQAHVPVYHVFLLTPSGINFYSSQTIGNRIDFGQTAFSKDGNYYGSREFRKNFEVFNFDRCSGIFSNPQIVLTNDSNVSFGLCFSPNSRLVYASSAHFLYQGNLDSADLTAGTQVVAYWDSTFDPVFGPPLEAGFEFMQIGPDGKIYMNTVWATHYMQYINYPDSVGVACGMQQHSLLLPTYNGNTIPNFVNYFLGPVVGSVCDSLGLGIPEHALHDFKFSIQPNPITGKILSCKYVLPQNKAGTIEVYDVIGKRLFIEILPPWSTEQHIKLPLVAGIYAVKITANRQQAVQKMIIQ